MVGPLTSNSGSRWREQNMTRNSGMITSHPTAARGQPAEDFPFARAHVELTNEGGGNLPAPFDYCRL